VLIVAPEIAPVQEELEKAGVDMQRVTLQQMPTNDTWSRDFGPITVIEDDRPVLLDFGFNGWGLKFAANFDNRITGNLTQAGVFSDQEVRIPGLILEGGSIESDGAGTLLTTSECLLDANRNPHLGRVEIESTLGRLFGSTDSHIDTLARLCPDDTIAYVRCDDPQDEHFTALAAMEAELQAFRTRDGRPYRLLPLPWPTACFDEDGQRLPATYANFLVINEAVLVPTYQDQQDTAALETIARAFPQRKVIGIDCLPLILQHGSLHCVTMQIPKGVLA
jgi:agmatine deiminase